MSIGLPDLCRSLTYKHLLLVATFHRIPSSRSTRSVPALLSSVLSHMCIQCPVMSAVFIPQDVSPAPVGGASAQLPSFPPRPLPPLEQAAFLRRWVDAFSPDSIQEVPCAVCASQIPRQDILVRRSRDLNLAPLVRPGAGVTRIERHSSSDIRAEIPGPILYTEAVFDRDSTEFLYICTRCSSSLDKGLLPLWSLANGRWIGAVPAPLRGLSYAEELLISRYRRNYCVAHVSGGQGYMKANAILFEQPVLKVYDALPPPRADLSECFALIFTGSVKPSGEDYKRTPFIVRHRVVFAALTWLKLNHDHYSDVSISPENLAQYIDNEPPVYVIHRVSTSGENVESNLAVNEAVDPRVAPADEECPFMLNALTASELGEMSYKQRLAYAIRYFDSGGHALGVGHEERPQSMYHNTGLFPGMYPWLYPYGLGGFENSRSIRRLDRVPHLRCNFLYADRRFQRDRSYAYVAFSHEQVRAGTSGGYLLTNKGNFDRVAEKLLSVDRDALDSIILRTRSGAYVQAETTAEKRCFELMSLVDHASAQVHGANARKKHQRSEIKSLIFLKGVPVFFVTFAPADTKNPYCLSFCGENVDLSSASPSLSSDSARLRAIASNPVGAARFFHRTVNALLGILLGIDHGRDGIFGKTSAYYGTVEEQGRKTLHLHLLIWIEGCPSPQELRDRVLGDVLFQQRLLAWLEQCHEGDFFTGTETELEAKWEQPGVDTVVQGHIKKGKPSLLIRDAATSLTLRPPDMQTEQEVLLWHHAFRSDVDRILFCSNRHDKDHGRGCLRGDPEYCRARFPREAFPATVVDQNSGAIRFRKRDLWINTFNPVLSGALRCNTDVTCLLSGTQVRAIIAYVTDYVTKSSMTTHTFFQTIRSVLDRNPDLTGAGGDDQAGAARSLVTKFVNALSAATEIGGPAACAHLLGHPDHYTDHSFKTFYWKGYVRQAVALMPEQLVSSFADSYGILTPLDQDRVLIGKSTGAVVAFSKVNDYLFRPTRCENQSLYDYLRGNDTRQLPRRKKAVGNSGSSASSSSDSDSADGDPAGPISTAATPGIMRFTREHPLFLTHGVRSRPSPALWTLNFAGGVLPRPDRGDHEEYCCVMLVLFAPSGWRTGNDLLRGASTWSAAFSNTSFSATALVAMKNMNVLYECLDARDDFAASRRAEGIRSLSLGGHTIDLDSVEADVTNVPSEDVTDTVLTDFLDEPGHSMGKLSAKNLAEMQSMSTLLLATYTGSRSCSRFVARASQSYVVGGLPMHAPSKWKNLVTDAKTAVQERRRARASPVSGLNDPSSESAASTEATLNHSASRPHIDLVTILTKADLDRLRGLGIETSPGSEDNYLRLIHSTIETYSLNEEQARAFCIAARHLHHPEREPLRMHLSGMGGTGKSRVLLAIMGFLVARGESHRFLVLGPTGTSAALIGGSTYHSVLFFGFEKDGLPSRATLEKIRERFQDVDLIFIDEISMISCTDLDRICSTLTKAFGSIDSSFGGKSIILAGDFAQLPPPGRGSSLYSTAVGAWSSALSFFAQRAALGKAVWHTFTTVVILRKNMRQTGLSSEDEAFRTCLNHMRSARCTSTDIALLNSRVYNPASPNLLSLDGFEAVSVITARNAHRDAVNIDSAIRFASKHGRTLHRFHSIDSWGRVKDSPSIRRAQREYDSIIDPVRNTDKIPPRLQNTLWAVPPAITDHHPGVLVICEGMPIVLKQNEATELGATNGATGHVAGWNSHSDGAGREILDVLFMCLHNPSEPVQISGLPLNIIPLTRAKRSIQCIVPIDDITISVQRDQVPCLPNFAVTDFGCQGQTRTLNIVHPRHSRNHQSMYTMTSRSSTLKDTIILEGFSFAKLQCGAAPGLMNEYCDLELLDAITKEHVDGTLPLAVHGSSRGELLSSYLSVRGTEYIPPNADSDLDWASYYRRRTPWSSKSTPQGKKPRAPATASPQSLKRSRPAELWAPAPQPQKITRLISSTPSPELSWRTGARWDSADWSCAYDSVLTVIWNLHFDEPDRLLSSLPVDNILTLFLVTQFRSLSRNTPSLETVRDSLRDILFMMQPDTFPRRGPSPASVSDLLLTLFTCPTAFGSSQVACTQCATQTPRRTDLCGSYLWSVLPDLLPASEDNAWDAQTVANALLVRAYRMHCPSCRTVSPVSTTLAVPPPLIFFDTANVLAFRVTPSISLLVAGIMHTWTLRGVIYHGFNHFTARYIGTDGSVWYHDGASTGQHCIREGDRIDQFDIRSARGRRACHYLYVL